MKILKGKNILVCVSGSIAIYKSLELIRLYIKSGANVKVLLTKKAQRFISALTFEAISSNRVFHEKTEDWSNSYNHIKITKDIDVVVFAPATANSINKLNAGICDSLLIQTLMANTKPLLLCPAMNTNMYKDQATQKSLKELKIKGVKIVKPVTKQLACKDTGKGALANIEDIFFNTCKLANNDKFWSEKDIIITGGGTYEKIDDVRYIGNFSSGKMAQNLALAFFIKGANVTLLTSQSVSKMPFCVINFTDTKSLKQKLNKLIQTNDYLFMAAAVSDYRTKSSKKGKLKKRDLGETWDLKLVQNEEILGSIKGIKKIGFKAEFDKSSALMNAKNMLKDKNLDAVCLNILGEDVNFSSENSRISFITKNDIKEFELQDKLSIGLKIANASKRL